MGTAKFPRVRAGILRVLGLAALVCGYSGAADATSPAWVGHVKAPTGLPGTPGGDGPWQIGRGGAVPFADLNGMWTWDNLTSPDSLQGWWPIVLPYDQTGGLTLPDTQRPAFALDYGNQANYVIPQGLKRTFGVVGVWHRDAGALVPHPTTPAATPAWTALQGSFSAWMGLRAHGDLSFLDPITGNPFNESVLVFNNADTSSGGGTLRRFPGYGSQMDQLLYRDVDLSSGGANSLQLGFQYRTVMSGDADLAAATRTGWFHHDPLSVTAGNFISSTDAGDSAAPRDSFSVYVGAPAEGSFVASDGLVRSIDDPMRRWFSETLRSGEGLYLQVFATAGTDSGAVALNIPYATLAPILAASGNQLRIVFRVKTNRGFDDQTGGFVSSGRGAATLDQVTYSMGGLVNPPGWGDFESALSIQNSPGVSAQNAWKSTGKPPQAFLHRDDLSGLLFNPGDPTECRMEDGVVSAGSHDDLEILPGGIAIGAAGGETRQGLVSPTINLVSAGPGVFNGQGIDAAIADATDDIFLRAELYTGAVDREGTGITVTIGAQSYPVLSASGLPAWSDLRVLSREVEGPPMGCFTLHEGLRANSLLTTSNPSGVPDSVRVLLAVQSRRAPAGNPPASSDGVYFDNVTLGFWDRYFVDERFLQMDFNGSTEPAILDTDWGALEITVPPAPDSVESYLNLVIRRDATSPVHWVIRNSMLISPHHLSDTTVIRHYFDLGPIRTAPGPIGTLEYRILRTTIPYATAPPALSFSAAPLIDAVYDSRGTTADSTSSEQEDPGPPPNPNGAAATTVSKPLEISHSEGMPSLEEEVSACFPTSVARSMRWLHQRGAINLGSKSDATLISEVKAGASWDGVNGVSGYANLLRGKLKVTKPYNMVNKFASSSFLPDTVQKNFTNSDGTAIHKGLPTFEFIKKEMAAGEDVEIVVGWLDAQGERVRGGHAMTVVQVKEDTLNGLRQIYVRDDPKQGEAGDKNVDTPVTYLDPAFGQHAKLVGIRANVVRMVISESPRQKPKRVGENVDWGSSATGKKPVTWRSRNGELGGRFQWTCGRTSIGTPIPHPGYESFVWTGDNDPTVRKQFHVPDDPTITDWRIVITEPDQKSSVYGGAIRRGSPWAFHPLVSIPDVDWKLPTLAPLGADTNLVIHMAVDGERYVILNRYGFLGGAWTTGQTLGGLGLSAVHGRIPGLEGVYLATSEFLFDPDSETGWVPSDTTTWLDSATFPYPIEITGAVQVGEDVVGVAIPPPARSELTLSSRPNPFTRETELNFVLPEPSRVELEVFDVAGRSVRRLLQGPLPAGEHQSVWDGRDARGAPAQAGVYYCRLQAGNRHTTLRLVLLDYPRSR